MPSVRLCSHRFHGKGHKLRAIEERFDLDALGQNVRVDVVNFFVNALQNRVGVVAFLQQHNAFHGVGIIDNCAVRVVPCAANLAQANLRSLLNDSNVLDANRRTIRGFDDGVFNVLNTMEEAERLHIDLLRAPAR